jgi:hypothetical protein
MVLASSLIVPAAPVNPANENAVMALAELGATFTVTVYVAVEPSAAVTVYAFGVAKLFVGAAPLVCAVVPTFTPVPVVVKFAVRAVTSVPDGRVTDIVFASSFTVPGNAVNPTNENAVMALAEFGATVMITVYGVVVVVPSAALTVYACGVVKLLAVVPLF